MNLYLTYNAHYLSYNSIFSFYFWMKDMYSGLWPLLWPPLVAIGRPFYPKSFETNVNIKKYFHFLLEVGQTIECLVENENKQKRIKYTWHGIYTSNITVLALYHLIISEIHCISWCNLSKDELFVHNYSSMYDILPLIGRYNAQWHECMVQFIISMLCIIRLVGYWQE